MSYKTTDFIQEKLIAITTRARGQTPPWSETQTQRDCTLRASECVIHQATRAAALKHTHTLSSLSSPTRATKHDHNCPAHLPCMQRGPCVSQHCYQPAPRHRRGTMQHEEAS